MSQDLYADKNDGINRLYQTFNPNRCYVAQELQLLHMALEIGIRMINGEGEPDGFEPSQFYSEAYLAQLTGFVVERKRDGLLSHAEIETARKEVQSLIRTMKFLKKDPQYTDRATFTRSPLYKESTILAKIASVGYYAEKTLFNRAINAVNIEWELGNDPEIDYKIKVRAFKNALYDLRHEVLAARRHDQCDQNASWTLATLAMELAEKIQKKTITQVDVDLIILAAHRECFTTAVSHKLNQLIYAAVAILALLCTAAAVISGAGVVGTVVATTAGLGLGISAARYTIWQHNKPIIDKVDCLGEAARLCI